MEEGGTTCASEDRDPPLVEVQTSTDTPDRCDISTDSDGLATSGSTIIANDESGVVLESLEDCNKNVTVESLNETCETNDDARSLGDLDSLPAGEDLMLGAAGSDSGVEGCGRALSSGGGSRSCASSVVSCGSGCGSESSSVAGAPPRPRRRVNVTEPKRGSPLGASTPRPATAPRGPNLATRERARSREKPTPPEKPRPLTPKPRIRPTGELPNLVRESPALRAKPTKTSTARCRTPSSPSEEKRWPSNGPRLTTPTDAAAARGAADKYGTLPRRRRENGDADGSPKHEVTPPLSRRPTVSRSVSTRSTTKTRVRIYAEKISQTVLLGSDVESALGGITPNIECSRSVVRCHRGVQASSRDAEARLAAAAAAAEAAAEAERARRRGAEAALAAERAARLAAIAELERNSQRLLELAGAGAGAGADGCLRALDEQLCAARELAARQRGDIDALRARCDRLQHEASDARESARATAARLAEAEREAAEMQDFLAAETGALGDSLRDAEAELARATHDLERRRAECRQLVRMCEQRRQEALGWAARARSGGGAAPALDALARRLRALTAAVARAYALPRHALEPSVYHNDAYSRSDSGEALSPDEEHGGLLAAVARALRPGPPATGPPATGPPATGPPATPGAADDERSRLSDDNDNSADLLDSETEPCLVTDPECAEEWWSGAEAAWSGDELSPGRESCDGDSEQDSLRNLSAAIASRQRSEDARGSLLERVLALDNRLTELLRALRLATAAAADDDAAKLAVALKDKIDVTERNVADVVVKKLAELDASKNMMEQYRQAIETLKNQLAQTGEEEDMEFIEKEMSTWPEAERARCAAALAGAARALAPPAAPATPAAPAPPAPAAGPPRLAPLRRRLQRLAARAAPQAAPPAPAHSTVESTA